MRVFMFLSVLTVAAAQYQYAQNTVPSSYATAQGSSSYASETEHASGQSSSLSLGSASEYNKEFYTYDAPAQDLNEGADSSALLQGLRKNLRVLFIRGPENNGLENAALNLAKASSGDRTAIYVLNKQLDIANLAQQIQNTQSQNHAKPEVHFVRYRTEDDVQNAQRAIYSQYDNLPGLSTSHGDAAASVINFASPSLPLSTGGQFSAPHTHPSIPAHNYLPPQ